MCLPIIRIDNIAINYYDLAYNSAIVRQHYIRDHFEHHSDNPV